MERNVEIYQKTKEENSQIIVYLLITLFFNLETWGWFCLPPSVPKSSCFTFEEIYSIMLSLPSALSRSFQSCSSSHFWHELYETGYRKPAWSSKSQALLFADEQFYRFSPRNTNYRKNVWDSLECTARYAIASNSADLVLKHKCGFCFSAYKACWYAMNQSKAH